MRAAGQRERREGVIRRFLKEKKVAPDKLSKALFFRNLWVGIGFVF